MATFTDKANEAIENGAYSAQGAVATAADKTSKAVDKAKEVAEDALDKGQDTLEGALICAKDMVRANPLVTVAAVAAIAYLWGRIKR